MLRKAHIYTVNPEVARFSSLTLEDKLTEATNSIRECDRIFQCLPDKGEDDICLIILPDLIFTTATTNAYFTSDHVQQLESSLSQLQSSLSSQTIVIPGAIKWVENNGYKIRSYYVTNETITPYDKKHPTHQLTIDGKVLNLIPGTQPNSFSFHKLKFGLEICQDHEKQTLKNELGNQTVDIHVLLANGQNIRNRSIACNPDNGLFVVCELQQGFQPYEFKQFETTACYRTQKKAPIIPPPSRSRSTQFIMRTVGTSALLEITKISTQPLANNIAYTNHPLPANLKVTPQQNRRPSHNDSQFTSHNDWFIYHLSGLFETNLKNIDMLMLPEGLSKMRNALRSSNHLSIIALKNITIECIANLTTQDTRPTVTLFKLIIHSINQLIENKLDKKDVLISNLTEIRENIESIVHDVYLSTVNNSPSNRKTLTYLQ